MRRTDRRDLSSLFAVVLVAWVLIVLVAGSAGVFESGPASPPLAVLVAVAAPPLVFAAAYRASRRFRDFVLAIESQAPHGAPELARAGRHVPRPLRVRSSSGRLRLAGRRR